MKEQENDELFEYIKKIQEVVEFLARDNEIETPNRTIISFDRGAARREGVISIEEVELCDTLEANYYNELGSIERIIEVINEHDYDVLKEQIAPYTSGPVNSEVVGKKFKTEYNSIKRRVREILNKIVIQLYIGLRVELSDADIAIIESYYHDENENEGKLDDTTDYSEMEYHEDFEYEEDNNKKEKKPASKPYLIYSGTQKKFYLMRDNEVLIDNVNTNIAMEIVAGYLYTKEKERKMEELQTGKASKKEYKYEGMHITTNDGRGEL